MTSMPEVPHNASTLQNLSNALMPASGISSQQLLDRINGMTIREVIDDAIQNATANTHNNSLSSFDGSKQ
jgi:hypothetical protein